MAKPCADQMASGHEPPVLDVVDRSTCNLGEAADIVADIRISRHSFLPASTQGTASAGFMFTYMTLVWMALLRPTS